MHGNAYLAREGGADRIQPCVGSPLSARGDYVAILRGAKPADLPVEAPPHSSWSSTSKTAKALEITVPLSLQAQADEVIE